MESGEYYFSEKKKKLLERYVLFKVASFRCPRHSHPWTKLRRWSHLPPYMSSYSCQFPSFQCPCSAVPCKHIHSPFTYIDIFMDHKNAFPRHPGSSLLSNFCHFSSALWSIHSANGQYTLSSICPPDPWVSLSLASLPSNPGGYSVWRVSTCDFPLGFLIGLASGELHQNTERSGEKSGFLLPPQQASLCWFHLLVAG